MYIVSVILWCLWVGVEVLCQGVQLVVDVRDICWVGVLLLCGLLCVIGWVVGWLFVEFLVFVVIGYVLFCILLCLIGWFGISWVVQWVD